MGAVLSTLEAVDLAATWIVRTYQTRRIDWMLADGDRSLDTGVLFPFLVKDEEKPLDLPHSSESGNCSDFYNNRIYFNESWVEEENEESCVFPISTNSKEKVNSSETTIRSSVNSDMTISSSVFEVSNSSSEDTIHTETEETGGCLSGMDTESPHTRNSSELELSTSNVDTTASSLPSEIAIPGSTILLEESINFDNLKHITFRGISKDHIAYILTHINDLQELVLLFSEEESLKLNLWDELTGGAPKSWSEIYDLMFNDILEGFKIADWEKISSRSDGAEAEFDKFFRDCFHKFAIYAADYVTQEKAEPLSSTLANLKKLELLKISACNAINFEAILYMTFSKKVKPLKNLQLEFAPGFMPTQCDVNRLRQYHEEVDVKPSTDETKSFQ